MAVAKNASAFLCGYYGSSRGSIAAVSFEANEIPVEDFANGNYHGTIECIGQVDTVDADVAFAVHAMMVMPKGAHMADAVLVRRDTRVTVIIPP